LHREIELEGDSNLLWHLLRELDGTKSSDELIHALPESTRDAGLHLLSMLIEAGALDASGRSTASFLHYATKKGNLPGTDLDLAEILTLVTDGDYRSYPERPRVVLGDDIPESVQGLRTLLRTRRSCRDFNGSPISRTEFDTILSTAAGVTGSLEWAGRRTHLRAYPSSGGLYAVELYPVVFGVAGLNSGVYHYRSVENALTLMHDDFYADNFISAALPSEREMLSGVAVMFCLTGVFVRHECKYGAGGYRMLVAEAGHLSQNLILSSVALDLDARPFGGVFDEMVNSALGLNTSQEQFLLSVIVGHAGVRNQ
jgi:SagB-type dehydrogenase family enzyme